VPDSKIQCQGLGHFSMSRKEPVMSEFREGLPDKEGNKELIKARTVIIGSTHRTSE
jgi:hypothetical protein